MAELMHRPHLLAKVREELDAVVGRDAVVEESHLPRLHYLHAVIKETLRLHQVLLLMVPHCPDADATVAGYRVPAGTRVFVNMWAIMRDPAVWKDPEEFVPERFLPSGADSGEGRKLDFNGSDMEQDLRGDHHGRPDDGLLAGDAPAGVRLGAARRRAAGPRGGRQRLRLDGVRPGDDGVSSWRRSMGCGLAEGGVGRGGEGRGDGWRWLLPPMQLPWPAPARGVKDAEDVSGWCEDGDVMGGVGGGPGGRRARGEWRRQRRPPWPRAG
jgi:hypothetical protein